MPNYGFGTGKAMPDVENGHTFTEYNFMQRDPHTSIFAGKTGLTFVVCNLLNCDVPADAMVDDCLTVQKSMCSHIHPDWGLDACVDNCSHVVDTDEVWIDGVLMETTYYYEDTVVE